MTNKECLRIGLGCGSNYFVWRAGGIVLVWSVVAAIAGLLFPEGDTLLIVTKLVCTVGLVLAGIALTVALRPHRRSRSCCSPGPKADARALIGQAERAIANGGRGIDITSLSDDEYLERIQRMNK